MDNKKLELNDLTAMPLSMDFIFQSDIENIALKNNFTLSVNGRNHENF